MVGSTHAICRGIAWFLLSLAIAPRVDALAAGVDATVTPGDHFFGRIAFADDVDVVEIAGLAGSRLDVVAVAETGSAVRPRIELWKGGQALAGVKGHVANQGRKHRVRTAVLASDGPIEVRVRGNAGTLGHYRLLTHERLPKRHDASVWLAAGEQSDVTFPARTGSNATFVLRSQWKGGPLTAPELEMPGGSSLDLATYATNATSNAVVELGPVPLTEDGTYRLRVVGAAPTSAKIRVHCAIDAKEKGYGSAVEAPGSASLTASLTLEDTTWLGSNASFVADEIVALIRTAGDRASVAHDLDCDVAAVSPSGWVRLRAHAAGPARRAMNGIERRRVRTLCDRARTDARIEDAVPNLLRQKSDVPTNAPNDPLFAEQWDFAKCDFVAAWELEPGDDTRFVAVLDTGIRAEHPDLAGRSAQGWDFVSDIWNAGDSTGVDPDPTDPFIGAGTHGTHVAGTILARVGDGVGVAGAAKQGKLMPVRVLGAFGGTDFDIAEGIRYAARLSNVSGNVPTQRAEVINMSLGGPGDSPLLRQAVADAVAAGVVVVVAAGNSASAQPMYPAAYPDVIAVSSTNAVDAIAFYSSFGNHVDLCAPGGDSTKDLNGDGIGDGIVSTVVESYVGASWAMKMGTSMATPHVAAAAFLVRCAQPGLTPLEVLAVLAAGSKDLGLPGLDPKFGHGRLDARGAIEIALGATGETSAPYAAPAHLFFGFSATAVKFAVIDRAGVDPLSIQSVTSDAFWLTTPSGAYSTPCEIGATVARVGLAPGDYTAHLHLVTSAGPLVVPVHMNVPSSGSPIPVREVHLLAVDVITGTVAKAVTVDENGAVNALLSGLPEGSYRIVATTDLDFDHIGAEGHDYAGFWADPDTGVDVFVLKDGDAITDIDLALVPGGPYHLPTGMNLVLP